MPPPPPKPTSLTPDSPFGGAGGTPAGAINPYASARQRGAGIRTAVLLGRSAAGIALGKRKANDRLLVQDDGRVDWLADAGVFADAPRAGDADTVCNYSMGLPVIAAAMVITPIGLVIALVAGGDDKLNIAAAVLGLSLAITAAVAVWLVIEATLFTIIRAAFLHLMLLIVGGGRHGYETTFRVVSYTRGSLFWCILIPIPYLNLMIMGIWSLVILIIGLSRADEFRVGKRRWRSFCRRLPSSA